MKGKHRISAVARAAGTTVHAIHNALKHGHIELENQDDDRVLKLLTDRDALAVFAFVVSVKWAGFPPGHPAGRRFASEVLEDLELFHAEGVPAAFARDRRFVVAELWGHVADPDNDTDPEEDKRDHWSLRLKMDRSGLRRVIDGDPESEPLPPTLGVIELDTVAIWKMVEGSGLFRSGQ